MSPRRPRKQPARDHTQRLLAALLANLEYTRDPALRQRLQAAIAMLKEKKAAAA
jgi:hypothetical protein